VSTTGRTTTRAVVVGGGIAGLAAAFVLAGRGDVRVTLCEADEGLGGKVRTEAFAGVSLDLGPDAFLARRPEAVALCQELGLADALVAPATAAAYLWSRGRLRRLPPGQALGVPTRFGPLARSGMLSPLGLPGWRSSPWCRAETSTTTKPWAPSCAAGWALSSPSPGRPTGGRHQCRRH
jgi:protoporphyrinogen oxidase